MWGLQPSGGDVLAQDSRIVAKNAALAN